MIKKPLNFNRVTKLYNELDRNINRFRRIRVRDYDALYRELEQTNATIEESEREFKDRLENEKAKFEETLISSGYPKDLMPVAMEECFRRVSASVEQLMEHGKSLRKITANKKEILDNESELITKWKHAKIIWDRIKNLKEKKGKLFKYNVGLFCDVYLGDNGLSKNAQRLEELNAESINLLNNLNKQNDNP